MALGGPALGPLGKRTKTRDNYFTCPNCLGANGTMTHIWMGFAADGPWVTRCDDCGWCDRCGRADHIGPKDPIGEFTDRMLDT